MTTNVTDSDAFTDPVVVPDDTEAANQASLLLFVQALANRTRYLLNRSTAARYDVSGSGVALASKYTLALGERSDSGYGLSSNEVQVPTAGWYRLSFTASVQNSGTSDPQPVSIVIMINGATTVARGRALRGSGTASDQVGLSCSVIRYFTTPASEKISIVEASGSGNGTIVGAESNLSIERIA